jgi:hypothetical protein
MGRWKEKGRYRLTDAVLPGVGVAWQQHNKSEDQLAQTGTQAPTSQYAPSEIDPSLQKGQGMYTSPMGKGGWRRGAQDNRQQKTEAAQGYTHQPEGWDQTQPGVSEQYWDRNQDKLQGPSATAGAYEQAQQTFGTPGQGEQYWQQVQGKFNNPTNAQAAYNRAQGRSADPGLGEYYDRAKTQTANTMNDQLAAMGMLGSSVGAQKMGNAISALDAERANREADYVMRQDQLVGQLGSAADSQNMSQLGLGGQMAGAAQGMGMSRAQDARRARGQDAFNNMYAPAMAMGQMVGDAQNDVLTNDAAYMDATMAAENGMLADQVDNSRYKSDRQKDDERHALDSGQQIMGMVGGMGGGGMGGMMGGGK